MWRFIQGRDPIEGDMEELLCSPSVENLPKDRQTRQRLLAAAERARETFMGVLEMILTLKENDERQLRPSAKLKVRLGKVNPPPTPLHRLVLGRVAITAISGIARNPYIILLYMILGNRLCNSF